jgi:hypothetical protein
MGGRAATRRASRSDARRSAGRQRGTHRSRRSCVLPDPVSGGIDDCDRSVAGHPAGSPPARPRKGPRVAPSSPGLSDWPARSRGQSRRAPRTLCSLKTGGASLSSLTTVSNPRLHACNSLIPHNECSRAARIPSRDRKVPPRRRHCDAPSLHCILSTATRLADISNLLTKQTDSGLSSDAVEDSLFSLDIL